MIAFWLAPLILPWNCASEPPGGRIVLPYPRSYVIQKLRSFVLEDLRSPKTQSMRTNGGKDKCLAEILRDCFLLTNLE